MAKKNKKAEFSPEAALQFLEDMRTMQGDRDELTSPIQIRVPGNILRAVKLQAKSKGKKYQSLMIEYIRRGLMSDR